MMKWIKDKLTCLLLLILLAMVTVMGAAMLFGGVSDWFKDTLFPDDYHVTDMTVVLEQVQALSELTTTRHTYSINITNEREDSILPEMLFSDILNMNIIAHVDAGIDMSLMTANSITLENGVFTLQLPAPVIQDCVIDERLTTVLSRDTGWLVGAAPELDTDTRRAVSRSLAHRAIDDDILEEANAQAQEMMSLFLGILPVSDDVNAIVVLTTLPDPEAPFTERCQ